MPLTQEQFSSLRKKGLSTDQIIKFEQGNKPTTTPQPTKKSPLQSYRDTSLSVAENTAAYGFEGVSRAAAGLTDLSGRGVAAASRAAGWLGDKLYRGVGNLGNDNWEAAWDKIGSDFKANQNQFANTFQKEGTKLSSFLSGAGEDARETLLEGNEGYQDYKKERSEKAADGKEEEFKWSDMTDADFWVHDIYGSVMQNAPTMALSLYSGAGVPSVLGKVGISTGLSTGMNASIEAESSYRQALDEGKSEDEALTEANRTFNRNSTANTGLEALQMMLIFSPQLKVTSPWLKALSNSVKIGAAGATESFQERIEDSIQEQAPNEQFDFAALKDKVFQAGISKTDAISFVIGALFQGGGNIFTQQQVEQAAKEQMEEVAARLPDDGQGGTAAEKIERANEPDVQEAFESFKQEVDSLSENLEQRAKQDRLVDLATNALEEGRSRQEVALALSGEIGADLAQELVQSIPEPRVEVKIPTADELLTSTPQDVQKSIADLDAKFDENTAELKSEIEELSQAVKDAPKNSAAKKSLKKTLSEKRSEFSKLSRDNQVQGTQAAKQSREVVLKVVKENSDLNTNEAEAVTDRIFGQILRPGLDVPVQTIIDNEVRKYKSPARATPEQVTELVKQSVKDKKAQEKLTNEVLDVLQDADLAPVVAELSLEQVVDEVQKKDGLFQVKNVARKPTGKAKFKNVHDEDLLKIAAYIDFTRLGQEAKPGLETAVRRLAERYGINPDLTPKQLSLAFERLIAKNKLDQRIDDIVAAELNAKAEAKTQKKESVKKPKKVAKKTVSPEIKKQIQSIPLLKSVPVRMVEKIISPDGQEAFGRFYRGTVEFVENPDKTTLPHESFHVYSQMVLTEQERKDMYREARTAYREPLETDLEVEERLAQDFAEWFVTEKAPATFTDRLIGYFRKLKDFLVSFVGKDTRVPLKKIFKDVLDPKNVAVARKQRQFSGAAFFQEKPKKKEIAEIAEGIQNEAEREFAALRFGSEADSSIFNELADKLEAVTYEVESLLEMAEAGYRIVNDDGTVRAVRSTFPEWIPEHLRSRELIDKVMKQRSEGLEANGSRQQELHEIIRDRILSQLPPEMLDQHILNEYFTEQQQVADELRYDAISVLQNLVAELDANPSVINKKDVKKTIRTSTGQIRTDTREFSRKMKERARFFNRGYKTGYKQGAKDRLAILLEQRKAKRTHDDHMSKLKSIYRRVKQATRSGAYLPIDYQKRLSDIFDEIDLTAMNKKTQKRLLESAAYFESQDGEVPKATAERLKRLTKIPVGKLSNESLEQIVTEVQRVFEQGVLKKQLLDKKGVKQFADRVKRVADSANNERGEKTGIRLSTLDPSRVADIVDNTNGTYDGAFFKEVVEPLRLKTDEADIETAALLADAFEDISQFGNTFTEEESARMMYYSAMEQDGLDQAEALKEYYPDYDFSKPLTEKERGALEVMKDTFKEIRGEIAAAYESQKNLPFPDNPNYFPFKYDNEVEKFDINEDSFFDFTPTKTSQGFTMTRQEGVRRVLDIDIFRTFTSQISKQLYYAKVQPVLTDATDIINAPQVQSSLTVQEQKFFKSFIKDVATRGGRMSDNAVIEALSKGTAILRNNINAAILGYKLSTVLIQPTAIFDAAASVNKRFGTVAAWKVVPNVLRMTFRPSLVREARARSMALENRAGGQIELKELRDAQRGQFSTSRWRKAYNAYQKYAYLGIKTLDLITATAAHDRMVTEFKKSGMSEADAILAADQMTALSQSSANIANRPQMLNNEGVKFMMPFQTFVTNAFNHVTYDLVETEIKKHGTALGSLRAANNLQFILFAVAAEAALRELYGELWGYEDEEEKRWYEKLYASTLGRIPLSNWFTDFDGELKDEIAIDHPAIESVNDVFKLLSKLAKGEKEATNKDIYKAVKGGLTVFGVPGTQQAHQIITAPDIAGLGSIGEDFNLTYDARNNHQKRIDAIAAFEGEIGENDIETLTAEVHGKDYEEGDATYKANKRAEMVEYVAFTQKFGVDDKFVDVALNKKNNNEVRGYVASSGLTEKEIKEYSKSIKLFGVENDIVASALTKELLAIAKTDANQKAKIAALAAAENDQERTEAIAGDKNFAKQAFSQYGLIDKTFYESIR